MLARFAREALRGLAGTTPTLNPRSNLQRVNYRLEDEGLWRDSYPVLDRAADTEPYSVMLLDGVEDMQLAFLASLEDLCRLQPGAAVPDTSNWVTNWVVDVGTPDAEIEESGWCRNQSAAGQGWGEMRRLYALPPL